MGSSCECQASEEHLKQHYIDLKDRPFFPGLVKYMNSGPVVAMVSAYGDQGKLIKAFEPFLPCFPSSLPSSSFLFEPKYVSA
jgi:hypothetical protein